MERAGRRVRVRGRGWLSLCKEKKKTGVNYPQCPSPPSLLLLCREMTASSFRPPLKQRSSFTRQLAELILLLSLLLQPFMRREPALSRPPVCPPSMKKRRRERGRGGVGGKQRLKELFRFSPSLKRILIHWAKTKPPLAWFRFSKAQHRFHPTSSQL